MGNYISYNSLLWSSAVIVVVPVIVNLLSRSTQRQQRRLIDTSHRHPSASSKSTCAALTAALPDSVFTSVHPTFVDSISSYYSAQECEVIPACVVRPRSVQEVSTAIQILRREYDLQDTNSPTPLQFAVRSGGHAPERGFANVDGGTVLDLSLLNGVEISEDRASTSIGTGARWGDVSSKLDSMGLAVAGGRNSHVGVGGLTLGGGISFSSARHGFVCNNILEFEIVLADGTITTASSRNNSDLWRALKGGGSNFGIVTRFTAQNFPSTPNVWGGYLFATIGKAPGYIKALHELAGTTNLDDYAAGPILSLAWLQKWRISAVGCTIAYMKPQKWPACFDGFNFVGRLWSTAKIQPLTKVTDELHAIAPSGLRQFQTVTTIKNDLETLNFAHSLWKDLIDKIRHVKGLTWPLVYQVLLPSMMKKDHDSVMGLASRDSSRIIILLCPSYKRVEDDDMVEKTARELISRLDEFAKSRGTSDPYRYLNYAASNQDVFTGYGKNNKQFLHQVARHYDPDKFFQRARVGSFHLGEED